MTQTQTQTPEREMKTLTNRPRAYHRYDPIRHVRHLAHRVRLVADLCARPRSPPPEPAMGFALSSYYTALLSVAVATETGKEFTNIPRPDVFMKSGLYHDILSGDVNSPHRATVIDELTKLLNYDPAHMYFLYFMEIQWDQFLMGRKDNNSVVSTLPNDVFGVIYKHLRSYCD